MINQYVSKRAEMEFRYMASMRLIPLEYCKTVDQLKNSIEEMHFLILELKKKYGEVPENATMMFARYMSKHDKLVYENFLKEYAF